MSFVALGGDAGSRPTFFEVYAADKLVPSLRAAIVYSLSVFGQSRAWVQRLLDYEDEVLAIATLLLDRHSLRSLEATFAESLYGLKRERRPLHSSGGGGGGGASDPPAPAGQPLGRSGENWALLLSVLLPYLQAKAERAYSRAAPHPGVLGLALRRAGNSSGTAARRARQGGATAADAWAERLQRARQAGLALFVRAYPFIHAGVEAARFGYQLAYLLDASDVHSPEMALLGQRLVRMSAPEMARLEQQKERSRAARLAAAQQRTNPVARGLSRAWLRARFAASDHVRSALILGVFGFKILEWWYTSAEDRLAAGKSLPPPPAPPPPEPHPGGIPLPEDPALCPLCCRPRVNPAALSVSGYVFCYPCVFGWVGQRRCCPVTHAPATLDHVRRLFEAG